jgi:5'-3' exonuclease
VDLFGSFYSILPKGRTQTDFDSSVRRLAKLLPPAANIHLVLDGKPTQQKKLTQMSRHESRQQDLKKLETLMAELESGEMKRCQNQSVNWSKS